MLCKGNFTQELGGNYFDNDLIHEQIKNGFFSLKGYATQEPGTGRWNRDTVSR